MKYLSLFFALTFFAFHSNSFFLKEGDYLVALKDRIAHGDSINKQNDRGESPLIWASKQGYSTLVEYAIEQGADLDLQAKYKNTALMWASHKGHLDIVMLLVESGATLNQQNSFNKTALDVASNDEIVEYLETKGATSCGTLVFSWLLCD